MKKEIKGTLAKCDSDNEIPNSRAKTISRDTAVSEEDTAKSDESFGAENLELQSEGHFAGVPKLVPLKKTDFDQVILLLKQLWPNKKIGEKNTKATLLKQLKDKKRHTLLVIKQNKETIGMITISWRLNLDFEGLLGSIDEFIIDKKYRGMGIGTDVLKKAIGICKKRKTKGLTILSALHRKEAHHFYIKNGIPKICYAFEKKL